MAYFQDLYFMVLKPILTSKIPRNDVNPVPNAMKEQTTCSKSKTIVRFRSDMGPKIFKVRFKLVKLFISCSPSSSSFV